MKDTWKAASKLRKPGLYRVRLTNGSEQVAELLPHDKNPPGWHQVSLGKSGIQRAPLSGVEQYRELTPGELQEYELSLLTEDERFDRMHQTYLSQFPPASDFAPVVPTSRQLRVGDPVEVGNLEDAVVAALRRDGQDVIVRHVHLDKKGAVRETTHTVFHWTDVIPKTTIRDTALSREPLLRNVYRTGLVRSLVEKLKAGLDDSPDYQRDYVWTMADKQRYIGSLLEGRDAGRFIFVVGHYPHRDEVLDGKQRLSCISQFISSAMDFQGIFWHELSTRDRTRFLERSVQFAELPPDTDRATRLRIFLEVNAAGVPQSEEHLQKVRELLQAEERLAAAS